MKSKHEKFLRIAGLRVNKARVAISRLAFLSNRGVYEYTESEVQQIIDSLQECINDVKATFSPKKKGVEVFEFAPNETTIQP